MVGIFGFYVTSAIDFYSKLFTFKCQVGTPPLSFEVSSIWDEDNIIMKEILTLEGLRSVVFSMDFDCAPCPNGLVLIFISLVGRLLKMICY